jgi:glycolate oxidase iron-sulfur subunit
VTAPAPEPFLDQRKSLACVHCGLCLSSCPTYLETGNENDSPRGRIYLMRALQEGRSELDPATVRHVDLCLGCRACEAACPSGVEYGALLESTRTHVEKHHRRSPWQTFLRRYLVERIFPYPSRLKLALWPARVARSLRVQRFLPKFARDSMSLIPEASSEGELPAIASPAGPCRGRVGFIRGCVMDVLFGSTNRASIELLNEAGFEVRTPSDQACCGALYSHGGNLEKARECARKNIAAFEQQGVDTIVINAAGCGSALKEYGHLLHDDPQWAARAAAFSDRVKDLSEMLAPQTISAEGSGARVTYHDACHLAHAQRITKQPRALVKAVVGDRFIELPESDVCCGSAGSYNLTEPDMAERLQRRKVENILRTGAKLVVTTNPGCLLQIRAGLKKAGADDIEVVHLADFLQQKNAKG